MRSPLAVWTLVKLSLIAALITPPASAGPPDDLELLQGTWNLTIDHWGRRDHEQKVGDISTWVISGNTLTVSGKSALQGTLTIDRTKKPARFVRIFANNPDSRVEGTFRLEGDTFKLYEATLRRFGVPVDFPDDPAPGYQLEVWKRIAGDGNEILDGTWQQTVFMNAGKKNIRSLFGENVMKIQGDSFQRRNEYRAKHEIKIDPSQDPKHLDLIWEPNVIWNEKHTDPRIYRLEGDRLTVWQGLGKRPTALVETPEVSIHYQVFERMKPAPAVRGTASPQS